MRIAVAGHVEGHRAHFTRTWPPASASPKTKKKKKKKKKGPFQFQPISTSLLPNETDSTRCFFLFLFFFFFFFCLAGFPFRVARRSAQVDRRQGRPTTTVAATMAASMACVGKEERSFLFLPSFWGAGGRRLRQERVCVRSSPMYGVGVRCTDHSLCAQHPGRPIPWGDHMRR